MFYAKIDPRTGGVLYVGMDGVPAPDQRAAQRAVQQACLMAEAAAPTGIDAEDPANESWEQNFFKNTNVQLDEE